ncbi:zinc finger MYM-type protein 2 isoform X2 [Hyperolius riggenbachi]|uniref:zinc finger MYM-type protein 2 isoform X2 n=1 Tax=Hyperolius riggenbachi TaxID=752182 RepID=UPI0035A2F57E
MATGLKNVGNAFAGPSPAKTFQNTGPVIVDDDDDVVFIEPIQVSKTAPPPAPRNTGFSAASNENHRADPKSHSSTKDGDSSKGTITETIIIDDEEEPEPARVPEKNASSFNNRRIVDSGRPGADFPPQSTFTRNKPNVGIVNSGITTEPDSEIQIANVTTLDSGLSSVSDSHEGRDMNLMITHVTSLQNPGMGEVSNGLQAPNFGGHAQTFSSPLASQNKPTTGPYNPGRVNVSSDVFQNGESATHHTSDGWLSQSASFPRNQQSGVDTISPVASLPKQGLQQPQPPPPQQPSKAVKVTCANCKKPLQKGQTAYQRKGSTHLFCSTSCLSSFSQKPAPKKLCTMCKKDITTMKGTIVAQVDSSESFQEFCSTYCLSLYEDKQNSAKNQNKSRCTICGKLTEIRHEVSFKNMTHKLCSDHCFNRYRMANGLIMNCCEHCGEYLPSKGAGSNVLMIDGQWKRFCSPGCLNDFKLKHGKLTSCTGCKAQCRIFDMTQCIGVNGHMEPYCSTTCMNNHKAKFIKPPPPPPPIQTLLPPPNPGIICHFCKRNSLPQYQATMPDGKLYNFCSSECVAKFQTLSIQSSTNGQHVSSDIQLKCNYCKNMFSTKPVTLDWEKKMYQFCSAICCDDYKKLHCIVTFCEYCQEEKTLHDTVKFSGVKKPFCSEGCKLLYKQDFAKRLGLKCVTCNYCFQICKRGSTKEFDGKIRDFCSEECGRKFHDWYYKAARCDCCRTQGTLKEKVQWRGIVKNFCDQQCLLRFYLQQNEPNMTTQKGPENMSLEHGFQAPRPRPMGVNCGTAVQQKDMKNKAVLCKPLSMTKATYCKPHMQTKTSQTEEDPNTKYVPVPIPVPVYVPVPMNLYSQKVPAPAVIPVPVPIPVFVPADWDTIKELNEEFKMKELLKENARVELEEKLKAEMKKQREFQESLDDEDMREAKRLKLDDHMDEDKQWDTLIVEEDEMKDESLKDVDELMEESLKNADELGEEPLKDKDILNDDLLKDEHEMKEESLKDEEELKEESVKDEEELKEESIKDEEELKEESIKDEDELKEESIKDEDELKEESLKDEDELKEESLKDEDELKESIKDDELKEESLKDEDEFKGESLKAEEDIKEESVSKNEGQLKGESLSKVQSELKESPTDKLRADSTKDEKELKELSKDDELGEEPSKDEDELRENPSEDELREEPSKDEDELREEPSKDEDELREEPSKDEDELREEPSKDEDELREEPSKDEDELREEPSKDEDELREEPSKDEDELREEPSKDEDELREEPSKDEDELREEPSKDEDELREEPSKDEDELREEPSKDEDELREEPSKDEDELREEPSKDEDEMREESSRDDELREEPSEDELGEISVKVVDDLGEESLENEDELREEPSKDGGGDEEDDDELGEISVKVVDDLGEETFENENELREPSPNNEFELMEESSLKDSDQLQEESQKGELQEEENRNAEEIKEDSLSSGSPFHPIEVLEISDPLDEEDALCGMTDEVQEDENCTTDTPSLPDVPCDLQLDIESDFQSGADELETESPMPPEFGEEYDQQSKPRPLKMGPKRKALWGDCSPPESSECTVSLKYSHGVDAWKHWATTAGEELGEMKLKENLLEHTPGELSILLPRFVREARRPNGDSYAPDSMYYLCLGIQEFLYSSERKENLFNDPEYREFGEELNVILRDWEPSILADGSMFYRVEEEHLWQAKQLGMHSPMTLLFTLLYFNTKYFYLRTVDQHLRLSFGTVLKRWKSNPLTQEKKACLQYQVSSSTESDSADKITPGKRKHEDDEPVFEQVENTADPSRCPVKTFEYYLSKSPPNLDQRMDVFYLNPESSSSPESLLWFTSTALDAKTLENMLIRVLLVKDIYEENRYELEEDTD